ncbi:ABC transporter permease, partial [bacterium]|nr:ABC transporter permease [bacterium]
MSLKQDLRYGFRMFSRTPGWSAVIVLSLALGIGANSAIFSLVNALLIRPLPYNDPEKLVMVWEEASFVGFPQNTPAPANYADWNSQNHVFTGMAAVATQSFNLTGSGEPIRLEAYEVTGNFFPLLGVRPVQGRVFLPAEDSPKANPVAVISHSLWQDRFAKSPEIIGKEILLNNVRHTVVGVMPKGFQFLDPEVQVWVPIAFTPEQISNRTGHYLQVIGRLKEGVSLTKAQAEMKTIMSRIAVEHPDEAGQLGITVVPLREQLLGTTHTQLILLSLAVGFVLLIACGNIANLLLSAGISRTKEIAVRAALGADRKRLVRQLLIESLMLSAAGGILGLVFSALSFSFLKQLIPQGLSLSIDLTLDSRILLFTGLVSVLTGLLFGLAPSMQAARSNLNDALKAGGARTGVGYGTRFRNVMVVAETALALVLLVGSALLVQTIYKLRTQDVGFHPQNVVRLETRLPRQQYDTLEKRAQFYDLVLERVESLPDVVSAGYSTAVPLDWKGGTSGYQWEGQTLRRSEILDANHREVSAHLLQTLGISLVRGRYFDGTETSSSMPVAIINEAMAATYPSDTSPIGKRFYGDSRWFTVIGIVRNIRNMGLQAEPKAEMYFPARQANFRHAFYAPKELLIRTKPDAKSVLPEVRQIIRSIDPGLPISHVMTLEFVLGREITDRRITMVLLVTFGLLALLLASTGIYGVLSYFVNQQIPEIGVRLALGAEPASILMLIMKRGLSLAVLGIVL